MKILFCNIDYPNLILGIVIGIIITAIYMNNSEAHGQSMGAIGNQTRCIAHAIYHETRAKNFEESVAIGNVIINRTKQPKIFGGSTPCEIIKKRGQFPWYSSTMDTSKYEPEPWRKSLLIAETIEGQDDYSNGALWFFTKPDRWFNDSINNGILIETIRFNSTRFFRKE